MDLIKSGNLKSRLKSVPKQTAAVEPESQIDQENQHRENLIFEVLGYMQTPNGSIEELVDKLVKSSKVSSKFIYTLLRNKWVKGYRLTKQTDVLKVRNGPIDEIELKNVNEAYISDKNTDLFLTVCHLYKFNESTKSHSIDEVYLFKDELRFPEEYKEFKIPEPIQDNSLISRSKWEKWNLKKINHQTSNSFQFNLNYSKLTQNNSSITSTFTQLQSTISQMKEMCDAVKQSFVNVNIHELKIFVDSIPARIKTLANDLSLQNGIIIRQDDLKLTPLFLDSFLNQNNVKENKEDVKEYRKSLVNLGGIELDNLMPLLKQVYTGKQLNLVKNRDKDFVNRRLTFSG